MRIYTAFASAITAACIVASPLAVGGEKPAGGEDLFNYHACNSCHGDRGMNPVSKVVPKIGGKSSDHIFREARKILHGEDTSDEAKIMHAAFYSPSQCDMPPSDAELQSIAAWLSKQ